MWMQSLVIKLIQKKNLLNLLKDKSKKKIEVDLQRDESDPFLLHPVDLNHHHQEEEEM